MNSAQFEYITKDLPDVCPSCGAEHTIILELDGEPMPFVECEACQFGAEGMDAEMAVDLFITDCRILEQRV